MWVGHVGTHKTERRRSEVSELGRQRIRITRRRLGRSLIIFDITILTQLQVVDWAGKGKLRKKHYRQSHGHGAPATNSIYYVSLGFIHNNINARHYTITDDDYPLSAPP